MTEFERTWQRILEAEPALAALFPRSPRYRFYSKGQRRFCWTTERDSTGFFMAFEYRPAGKGSRTGNAKTLKLAHEIHFRTRKAAKARAWKWYQNATQEETR